MSTAEKPAKIPRGQQPKCGRCSHPKSFHAGGTGRCQALGCHNCEGFVDAAAAREDLLETTLSVSEAAKHVGRGQTWVKEHAADLGGFKVQNRLLGKNTPGETWRFPRETLPTSV